MLGYWTFLGKILRVSKRDRENARERAKSIIRQMGEAEGVVREARDRERNARYKAIGGIIY